MKVVLAQARVDESVETYLRRIRSLMGIEDRDHPLGHRIRQDSRLVVCIHGWSHSADEHRKALGRELRVHLEGAALSRPFSMVAMGSDVLFRLRYSGDPLSVLTGAQEVRLPDLSEEEIHVLMEQIDRGRWIRADAREVEHRSGGHPFLVKLMLQAWLHDPAGGWSAAEAALEEDRNYLLPQLAVALQAPTKKRVLRRCLDAPAGIRFNPLNPHSAEHSLYYDGLLREQGRRSTFRCAVVRRLVEAALAEGR
jgi:hypothetical protein